MDLYGWDTAYATSIAEVNHSLADPKAVPAAFNITAQGMSVQGQFGAWSIVPGGSGELLHLQTAIVSGNISGANLPSADLAGLAVVLEINLQLLPSSLPHQQDLKFNLKTVGAANTPSAPGVVKPILVLDPTKKLSFAQVAVLGAAVAQSMCDQSAAVSFSFANINLVPPSAGDTWLTPASCSYSYYQTGGGAGYLVILSATNTRDTSGLGRKIDPELIGGSGTVFYAISQSLFLQHVIQPILPTVYAGTDSSFYSFDASSQTILATKAIGLPGTQKGAITYYPEITHLQIGVTGSNVTANASGDCDLKMGMSMTFSVSSRSASSVNPANGELSLAKDPNPSESHDSHIPWYDYLMGAIPDIIMAIVVPVIADGIASGLSAQIKGMQFAYAGAQNVQCAGMKKFTISGGQLNSAFRLWGTLG